MHGIARLGMCQAELQQPLRRQAVTGAAETDARLRETPQSQPGISIVHRL